MLAWPLVAGVAAQDVLRAMGLMRERGGRLCSLQPVGPHRTLAEAALAPARPGRLVCIALRGELPAERSRAALAAGAACAA